MKSIQFYLFIACFVMLSVIEAQAQTFSPKVTPTTGGYAALGSTMNISWTLGETIIPTVSAGSYQFSQGFQQPEVQVITNNISPVVCSGNTVQVPYTAYGIIGSNNMFTAQLSNASGSFNNPVNIGTAIGNSSGIINAFIPVSTPGGSFYRIRVVSSLPLFMGKKNNTNITMNVSPTSSSAASSLGCYTWNMNNATYTTTGVYTYHVANATGCDSIYILNLNVTNGLNVTPKVILSGPYNPVNGLMYDSLRVNNLIPASEPYSSSPFYKPQLGGAGGETVSAQTLSVSGDNAIVDWIFVELRSASNPSNIMATKRALLQRDGDVVSNIDGVSPVFFAGIEPGNYYVSIKHRNHLGVMTNNSVGLLPCNTNLDFTTSAPVWTIPSQANPPRKVQGTVYALWSGDAYYNKNIKYNGLSNDKDQILNTVGGGGNSNNTLYGYRPEDVNMDGKIRYNNTDNDRIIIINNVGTNTPNNVIIQHTPN